MPVQMFEEAQLSQNQLQNSPRKKACLRQCRLAKFREVGTIFEGGCPCERPSACQFKLPGYSDDEDDYHLMFPDVRSYIRNLANET